MAGEQVDPLAVLAALGVRDATDATPVSGGWDTTIWRVDRGGVPHALRLFRAEQAATARREVAAMGAATGAGLPVPAIVAAGSWQDRPALLLAWAPGRPLLHELSARPWRAWSLGVTFGLTQAQIHAVAAPAQLREEPERWLALAGPHAEALRARLCLDPPDACLLHLDYHPLNVMVETGRVSGVLDWANAAAGPRRADLARTLTILRLSPLPTGLPRLLVTAVRRRFEQGWRHGYRQSSGALRGMAPYYAWAGAMMHRDLAPKIGRPGMPLNASHLGAIAAWTAYWKARAGVVDG